MIRECEIAQIVVPGRHRAFRDVSTLAASISRVGLLQPIVVSESMSLIAGLHRLEAFKALGRTAIPANVLSISDIEAEIAEIDENFERNELTALERAEHFARRKALYEAAHPESRHGGLPGKAGGGKVAKDETVSSFAIEAASSSGLSPRSIQHDVQIASNIPEDVRDAIRATPLADEKRELIALARLPEGEQRRVVEDIAAGNAKKVADVVHNHRAQGTGENEWYTPAAHIEAARAFLGTIDLDPASSATANETVRAARFFSVDENGLAQDWEGRVWLNPPYAQPWIAQFMAKMVDEYNAGRVSEAIALTHNYTDTVWFHCAASAASAICLTRGRIGFLSPDGKKAAPTQGQAFFYYGTRPADFAKSFEQFGLVVTRCEHSVS